jgi:hypothetical protein
MNEIKQAAGNVLQSFFLQSNNYIHVPFRRQLKMSGQTNIWVKFIIKSYFGKNWNGCCKEVIALQRVTLQRFSDTWYLLLCRKSIWTWMVKFLLNVPALPVGYSYYYFGLISHWNGRFWYKPWLNHLSGFPPHSVIISLTITHTTWTFSQLSHTLLDHFPSKPPHCWIISPAILHTTWTFP